MNHQVEQELATWISWSPSEKSFNKFITMITSFENLKYELHYNQVPQ